MLKNGREKTWKLWYRKVNRWASTSALALAPFICTQWDSCNASECESYQACELASTEVLSTKLIDRKSVV